MGTPDRLAAGLSPHAGGCFGRKRVLAGFEEFTTGMFALTIVGQANDYYAMCGLMSLWRA
jgi:hypothetical protein